MKKELTITTKNFWEIPGYSKSTHCFELPVKNRTATFCCSNFNDQKVVVYSVDGVTVGYFQPSWQEAVFVDVNDSYHPCYNVDNGEVVPIYLKSLNDGVQWTSISEDGYEDIFIPLI